LTSEQAAPTEVPQPKDDQMPSNPGGSPDVWVQSRRRIDIMLGTSLIAIATAGLWVAGQDASKVFPLLGLLGMVGVMWLVLRRAIPIEGQRYPAGEIRRQHQGMMAIAAISLPWILITFGIAWLELPNPEWFYGGTCVFFVTMLILVLGRLDRIHRRSREVNSNAIEKYGHNTV
jgi:hypothetical protein